MTIDEWRSIGAGPARPYAIAAQSSAKESTETRGLVENVRPDPRINTLAPRDESRELLAAFKKRKPDVIREVSQLIIQDGVLPLLSLASID